MQYTTLGKTGLKVSRLGFGCMRLPMKSEKEVDRSLAIPMLHRAVELGITYFDTAVGYCGGDSQRVLGEAMESIRDRVVLSTKNHHYDKTDKDGWWRNLNDSIERLRTDHIDIYNFHGMNFERFEAALDGEDGLYAEVLKAREQGLIRHICHSFHGSVESLKKCVDTGLFESITVQYNLLDQSLEEGIAYAADHGMGVVIMGPVGGGRLGFPSGQAKEIAGEVKSTPELALRFVLSNDHVNVALSGMSSMQQLEENVATVSELGALTADDHRRIEEAVSERKKLAGLYCTGCNYCMPCPENVDIPANFEILNLERVFGLTEHAKTRYAALGGPAALCRVCGKCIELCPQELDIPTRLGEAVMLLDKRAGMVSGWGELASSALLDDGSLSVQFQYHVKNFSEATIDSVTVGLHGHLESEVVPTEFSIDRIKGFGRRRKDIDIRLLPPVETIQIDSEVMFEGNHEITHHGYVVACSSPAHGFGAIHDRPEMPTVHVPSVLQNALPQSAEMPQHSFDFTVCHDQDHLCIRVEVEDDLARLASSVPVGRVTVDHLRLYLDARAPGEMGRGGYGDGAFHVTMYPSAGDAGPLFTVTNDSDIRVELVRTKFGYICSCEIPWTALGRNDAPKVMGFDIALVSFGDNGERHARLSWTGREGQDRSTANLGRLLLP